MAGDQQAALFGQACFSPGQAKCTYGTGSFLMMQTGNKPVKSENRLLTTIAGESKTRSHMPWKAAFLMQAAVSNGLKDELGLISDDPEIDILAESVEDSTGIFVSAFTGLARLIGYVCQRSYAGDH